MIDIHSHIIPEIDDGSPSIAESLKMLASEVAEGVDTVIATPHHNILRNYMSSPKEIQEKFSELKAEAEKAGLPVKLLLGQEIFFSTVEDVVSMLDKGELLTLAGTKNVLLEFSFTNRPHHIVDAMYPFFAHGYQVIIAHIERYEWMTEELAIELKEEGCMIQINAGSVLGNNGKQAKNLCKSLLKCGVVDFVASDVHAFRSPHLQDALKKVKNERLFEGFEI